MTVAAPTHQKCPAFGAEPAEQSPTLRVGGDPECQRRRHCRTITATVDSSAHIAYTDVWGAHDQHLRPARPPHREQRPKATSPTPTTTRTGVTQKVDGLTVAPANYDSAGELSGPVIRPDREAATAQSQLDARDRPAAHRLTGTSQGHASQSDVVTGAGRTGRHRDRRRAAGTATATTPSALTSATFPVTLQLRVRAPTPAASLPGPGRTPTARLDRQTLTGPTVRLRRPAHLDHDPTFSALAYDSHNNTHPRTKTSATTRRPTRHHLHPPAGTARFTPTSPAPTRSRPAPATAHTDTDSVTCASTVPVQPCSSSTTERVGTANPLKKPPHRHGLHRHPRRRQLDLDVLPPGCSKEPRLDLRVCRRRSLGDKLRHPTLRSWQGQVHGRDGMMALSVAPTTGPSGRPRLGRGAQHPLAAGSPDRHRRWHAVSFEWGAARRQRGEDRQLTSNSSRYVVLRLQDNDTMSGYTAPRPGRVSPPRRQRPVQHHGWALSTPPSWAATARRNRPPSRRRPNQQLPARTWRSSSTGRQQRPTPNSLTYNWAQTLAPR